MTWPDMATYLATFWPHVTESAHGWVSDECCALRGRCASFAERDTDLRVCGDGGREPVAANRFELLATWYLRFNGYFTVPDFTVHPDFRKEAGGTDADVLAVRFPHSDEYQRRFEFCRDQALVRQDCVDFLICEVKAGRCEINAKTWRDPLRRNVEYVLRWMGFTSDPERIEALAKMVYETGACETDEEPISVRFVCFGSQENHELAEELPSVHQICHSRAVGFLRERFTTGCYQITRENWDRDIIEFAGLCRACDDAELMHWAAAKTDELAPACKEEGDQAGG